MKFLSVFLFIAFSANTLSQTDISSTSAIAESVLTGDFDPSDYAASIIIDQPNDIVSDINDQINADSLKSYLFQLSTFENRNTGSDTISSDFGIGAARRWAFEKFKAISEDNENRLIPSYLQFDQMICGMGQHRNIFAVLPGASIEPHEVVLIEAHLDSRCEDGCDVLCDAHGMEDNGSGSALVIELARVMSQFTYKNTIVFMLTIGEEQGLYGANAFSQYALDHNIPIKAVLNNDVIGGVICGETSSAPSCPGENEIDSTQVRFFTEGGFNSRNKQLARFIKLQYEEELLPIVSVPMELTIMSAEDRVGRGGDHIPFRQDGFTAMRFTSAHEHGDAGVGDDYHDRQHTSDDILGVDTDDDMEIDSFFVDFNYLARNAVINGAGASMAAIGPPACDFSIETFEGPGIIIKILDEVGHDNYRVGLRTATNDWDEVYLMEGTQDTLFPPVSDNYIVSVASVDENGVESLFSKEIAFTHGELTIPTENQQSQPFQLLQNRPNPFDESTIIGVKIGNTIKYKTAHILIQDASGKEVERLPINLNGEIAEVLYHHGYGKVGVFLYTLVVDDQPISTRRMIFAN